VKRILIAAALAVATLPALALQASAAPGSIYFGKPFVLQCDANGYDGTALKPRLMLKNTSGRIIPQGTSITIRFGYGYGPAYTEIAYRTVYVNDSIGFNPPGFKGRCVAMVTLRPIHSSGVLIRR
jgi:hypothetical protein